MVHMETQYPAEDSKQSVCPEAVATREYVDKFSGAKV